MKPCLIIAVALMTPALALSKGYTIYKGVQCGNFMSDPKNTVQVALVSEYLRGFLSAHNIFSGRIQADADLTNNTLGLWAEKYCTANPLSDIGSAGAALVYELTGPLTFKK